MSSVQTLWLTVIFFVTSSISVVTGGTSLITVPAMFQFHIDPRIAIATNMFALTFMSIGGTLPFLKRQDVNHKRVPALIALTLFGSMVGAFMLFLIPPRAVSTIVSASVIAIAILALIYQKFGVESRPIPPSVRAELAGYALTFVLGTYGGFFSGGYVTILTAIYVALFRLSFVEAVATTKLLNVFSSSVSTGVFIWHGLVDYRLGLILGAAMFVGAFVGARLAIRIGNEWLRRIFLTAVWVLGLKALLFDVLGVRVHGKVPALGHTR
jgi:uncharacterized membrane protein YfcA